MKEFKESTYESAADRQGHMMFDLYAPGHQIGGHEPHYHDSIEIVFVLEGEYLMHVGSEERVLARGSMGFVAPYAVHYYRCLDPNSRSYVIVASSRYLLASPGGPAFEPFSSERAGFGAIERFLGEAYGEFTDTYGKSDGESLRIGMINYLLGLMEKYYPHSSTERPKNAAVFIDVMTYIDEHFAEDLTLASLADRYGYTKSYFSSTFNRFTGMSLREFLNRRRIREFVKRRDGGERSALKLAAECGFASPNTFYRALAKYSER